MSGFGKEAALKTAQYHRDHATSEGLRRYWDLVIAGIERKPA